MPSSIQRSAENTITFASDAVGHFSKGVSAHNDLGFADALSSNFKILGVNQSLGLTSSPHSPVSVQSDPAGDLALQQTVGLVGPVLAGSSSQLILSDLFVASIKGANAVTSINLVSTVTVSRPINISVSHNLSLPSPGDIPPDEIPSISDPDFIPKMAAAIAAHSLRDEIVIRRSITNLSPTSLLSFATAGSRQVGDLSVESHIQLSQLARTVSTGDASSQLSLSQSVLVLPSTSIRQTLHFTDSVHVNWAFARSVSSHLDFREALDQYNGSLAQQPPVPRGDNIRAGSADARQVSPNPVTLTRAREVIFTYPYDVPDLTVVLRPPLLVDREALNYRRVARNVRGGKFEIFRRNIWPKWNRHQMTFTAMSEDQRHQVFSLLHRSLGKDVGFLDHEGRQWRGIITTPAALMKETGRQCKNEITIEFQGELV